MIRKITKQDMAFYFEMRSEGVMHKILAAELGVDYHWLFRMIVQAKEHGFDAWVPDIRK